MGLHWDRKITIIPYLEPPSFRQGWSHPGSEEDTAHTKQGPGDQHEDTVCSNEGQFGEIVLFPPGIIPHGVVSFGRYLGKLLVGKETVGKRHCLPTTEEDIDLRI